MKHTLLSCNFFMHTFSHCPSPTHFPLYFVLFDEWFRYFRFLIMFCLSYFGPFFRSLFSWLFSFGHRKWWNSKIWSIIQYIDKGNTSPRNAFHLNENWTLVPDHIVCALFFAQLVSNFILSSILEVFGILRCSKQRLKSWIALSDSCTPKSLIVIRNPENKSAQIKLLIVVTNFPTFQLISI